MKVRERACQRLSRIIERGIYCIMGDAVQRISIEPNIALTISQRGIVDGWETVLGLANGWLRNIWLDMHGNEWMTLTIHTHDHKPHLQDVVFFLLRAYGGKFRFSTAAQRQVRINLEMLMWRMFSLLGSLIETYVGDVYSVSHDLFAPHRRPAHRHAPVDPVAIWNVLEKAQKARINHDVTAREVVRIQTDLPILQGIAPASADNWTRIEGCVHQDKQLALFRNTNHLSVVMDPSKYDGVEWGVGCCWSWEIAQAAYMKAVRVPSKPIVELAEFSVLPCVIEFARHSKLQRTAAYSQEQCLWAGINISSGHSLSQFEVPPGFVIRPVAMGETRMLENDPDDPSLSYAYFKDQFVFVCNVIGLVTGRSACYCKETRFTLES